MIDYDLHIHSKASDGVLTPDEIFQISKNKGLKGISITDHDTVDAVAKGMELSDTYGLDFIPGIELSTECYGAEVHLLGYYINYSNKDLLSLLEKLKFERADRLNKMIKKINTLGYEVSIDDVIEQAGSSYNSLGRPHLARALIKKGYFKNVQDVFKKLISSGMPGYVERYKFPTFDGIDTIIKFGGVPVLAHPGLIKNKNTSLDVFIGRLVSAGLKGIEVYHTDQSLEMSSYLLGIAYKQNLIITGGSDYHAPSTQRELSIGNKGVLEAEVEKLKEMHKNYIIL